MAADGLVSVVLPVYDGERYLAAAMESVLVQDAELEIIVVDDGSSDATPEVIASFGRRVRHLQQAHLGVAQARNLGAREARGALLAFHDADDLWSPGKLRRQLRRLSEWPKLDAVFGCVEEFVSEDLSAAEAARLRPRPGAHEGYLAQTMLIRRSAFERVGPFSTRWRVGEFLEWFARAREAQLEMELLEDVVLRRRLHAGNMGRRERDARAEYVRLMKATLDRRRGRGAG